MRGDRTSRRHRVQSGTATCQFIKCEWCRPPGDEVIVLGVDIERMAPGRSSPPQANAFCANMIADRPEYLVSNREARVRPPRMHEPTKTRGKLRVIWHSADTSCRRLGGCARVRRTGVRRRCGTGGSCSRVASVQVSSGGRADELRQLPHPSAALRQQTQLGPTPHHHTR